MSEFNCKKNIHTYKGNSDSQSVRSGL